jgi:CheY-like chemotaxis protein
MIDDKISKGYSDCQDTAGSTENRRFRVLVVDDETQILKMISRMVSRGLPGSDIAIDSFTSPHTALEKLASEQYAVVISDYCILDPETKTTVMFGDELLSRVKEVQPLATRVIMSGSNVRDEGIFYPEGSAVPSTIPHYAIAKPFNNGDLVEIVKRGIDDYLSRAK